VAMRVHRDGLLGMRIEDPCVHRSVQTKERSVNMTFVGDDRVYADKVTKYHA